VSRDSSVIWLACCSEQTQLIHLKPIQLHSIQLNTSREGQKGRWGNRQKRNRETNNLSPPFHPYSPNKSPHTSTYPPDSYTNRTHPSIPANHPHPQCVQTVLAFPLMLYSLVPDALLIPERANLAIEAVHLRIPIYPINKSSTKQPPLQMHRSPHSPLEYRHGMDRQGKKTQNIPH